MAHAAIPDSGVDALQGAVHILNDLYAQNANYRQTCSQVEGIPGVIYGAGPRTVLKSHAKRANERLDLQDLRRATKVMARALSDSLMTAT